MSDFELCRDSNDHPPDISLHQALLLLAPNEHWTPISETVFSCLEGLPPPDDDAAKRLLLLALVKGRLQHSGQLIRMDQPRKAGEQPNTLLDPEYRALPHQWSYKRVCFASSELTLHDTSIMVGSQCFEGIFKLVRIRVSTEGVMKLRSTLRSSKGGRPMKKKALILAGYFICAYIHCVGLPERPVVLVQATLEYLEQLPEAERIGKTTVEELVRGYLRAIHEFDS
jgi:hypothetical protein